MTNPVPGFRVTTPYGKRGSAWASGVHGGADYAAPAGTKVLAPWSGTVVEVGRTSWGSAFGTAVLIDFDKLPDGRAGLWGLCAHLSAALAKPGQRIAAGTTIGRVGSTGNSSGPHLHFEVRTARGYSAGKHTNPQPWIDATKGTPPMAAWYRYSGKPKGQIRLPGDGRFMALDATIPAPPRAGREDRMVYLNVTPTWRLPKSDPLYAFQTASLRVRWSRSGAKPDPTAYQDFTITPHRPTYLLTHVHWELGEKGRGGRWSVSMVGHASTALIGTRYTKGAQP